MITDTGRQINTQILVIHANSAPLYALCAPVRIRMPAGLQMQRPAAENVPSLPRIPIPVKEPVSLWTFYHWAGRNLIEPPTLPRQMAGSALMPPNPDFAGKQCRYLHRVRFPALL